MTDDDRTTEIETRTECDHSRPDGGTLFTDVGEDRLRCSYCGAAVETRTTAGAEDDEYPPRCPVPGCGRPQAVEERGWLDGDPRCDLHIGSDRTVA